MQTRVYRSMVLVLIVAAMLVVSFPSMTVQAAYRPVSSVILTVGSSTMTVNGFDFPVDSANPKVVPTLQADWNRALVPIRNIVELTGGDVTWTPSTRVVCLWLASHTVELRVGNPTATLMGAQCGLTRITGLCRPSFSVA